MYSLKDLFYQVQIAFTTEDKVVITNRRDQKEGSRIRAVDKYFMQIRYSRLSQDVYYNNYGIAKSF